MSTIAVNAITDASGGNTASINGATPTNDNLMGRNRIINGDMRIDQRNAGASVTPTTDVTYTIDRWSTRNYSGSGRFSVEQVSASLASFEYAAKLTVTTTDTPGTYGYAFGHRIEGYNVADLGFGTSDAQTVTLSFWVKSSIAGTYCVSLRNNTATDSYVAEYSISSANTWEKKTITITGPTSGTWIKTNEIGAIFEWSLGSQTSKQTTANAWQSGNYVTTSNQTAWIATNGATFYITGVQLEAGSVATSFERRHYGQELALCQRYFYKTYNTETAVGESTSVGASMLETIAAGTLSRIKIFNSSFPVTMRTTPTVTVYAQGGDINSISVYNNTASTLAVSSLSGTGATGFGRYVTTSTNGSASQSYSAHFTASAEL